MSPLILLIITSLACSIIGVFLVLRRQAMISDAISHTVLLGIILAYFAVRDLNSPFLIIAAAFFGVLTVVVIEFITDKLKIASDASIGIVFTLFFAFAVILISKHARNIHISTDQILMGEVLFAPLNTMNIFGLELPKAFVWMSAILLINTIFILVNYRRLKLITFDEQYALMAGISVELLHYSLMSLISMTIVTAFNTVGSILVISFLVAAPLTAWLIAKSLFSMMSLTILISVINCILGFLFANAFNVSMSGMCVVVSGITFLAVFLFNKDGLIKQRISKGR